MHFSYVLLSLLILNSSHANQQNDLSKHHDILLIKDIKKDYKVENTYSIVSQPPLPENYRQSLAYSINSFHPFTKLQHISKYGSEVIYNQVYESADFGLRAIPKSYYAKNPTQHVIVAGDSNIFGDGVGVENTLPILLANEIPTSHPYNFGIRGGGPHHTLAFMEFFPWENIIKEKKGIFIYNYYDLLFERVIGLKNYILWSKGITPYYNINDKGVATYQGNFNTRFLTKIFQFLNSFEWLNKLLPTLPRPRHQHTVIIGKIFLKMYNEYIKKFPKGKFYVAVNYNFYPFVSERLKDLEGELTKNKVPYIAIPFETDNNEYVFKDYHLNPKGHQLEAKLILKVLPLNKITSKPNISSTDHNQMQDLRD